MRSENTRRDSSVRTKLLQLKISGSWLFRPKCQKLNLLNISLVSVLKGGILSLRNMHIFNVSNTLKFDKCIYCIYTVLKAVCPPGQKSYEYNSRAQ